MKSLAIATSVLALTACTIERTVVSEPTDPPTTPATTQPAPPPTQSRRSTEQDFADAVRQAHAGPVYVSDKDIIDTGWSVCDGFAAGQTVEDAIALAVDSASTEDSLNLLFEVIAGAVVYLCPEFDYLMENLGADL